MSSSIPRPYGLRYVNKVDGDGDRALYNNRVDGMLLQSESQETEREGNGGGAFGGEGGSGYLSTQ